MVESARNPRVAERKYGIARKLELLRGDSPYISIEAAEQLAGDKSQSYAMQVAAEKCQEDIKVNGKDALAHLCLQAEAWNSLKRSGVENIPQLRNLLNARILSLDHAAGRKMLKYIIDRLYGFDFLVRVQEYNEQLKWAQSYKRKLPL